MNILAAPICSHRLLPILALFCFCLATAGCRSEYRLEMSAEKGVLQRTVISGADEDSPPEHVVLSPGQLPDDLGEHGWFLHEDTTMGSLNLYVEQFDWFTDPSASLDMHRFAVHRLVDVWLAWLDSEFSPDPRYADFRAFVDTDIRADIEDLYFITWGYGAFGPSLTPFDDESNASLFGEIAVRGLTYLALRGYFEPLDVPEIVAAFGGSNQYGTYAPMADVGARAIARRMGLDEDAPLPYPLSELQAQPHRYLGSYEYFVSDSMAMRALVLRWGQKYPDFIAETKPEPVEPEAEKPAAPAPVVSSEPLLIEDIVLPEGDLEPIAMPAKIDFQGKYGPDRVDGTLLMYILGADDASFTFGDGLQASLRIPTEPLWTNAHVVEGNRLEWAETFDGMTLYSNAMSTLFYAAWAEPDVDYQREKFGDLVLEGKALANYVAWHRQLKPHHAKEWDRFIGTFEPSAENIEKLRFFHFSDEPDSIVEVVPELNAEQEIIGERVVNGSIASGGAEDIIYSLRSDDEEGGPQAP